MIKIVEQIETKFPFNFDYPMMFDELKVEISRKVFSRRELVKTLLLGIHTRIHNSDNLDLLIMNKHTFAYYGPYQISSIPSFFTTKLSCK